MKKIGFIGYGNMGKVIINGFLLSGALKPEEMILSTRSENKLSNLKELYLGIEIARNNCIIASESDLLFLLVGTKDVKDVLEEIKNYTNENTHIIYIAAGLTMEIVGRMFKGKISKAIPSITSEVLEGVTLICHNPGVSKEEADYVNNLFNSIGQLKIVEENDFEVGTELTSCSPAFIARIFMEFARKAALNSGFSIRESEDMLIEALYGTSKLLKKKDIDFENLLSSVATKGGITEEGLKVLDDELPELFDKLFEKTIEKHGIIKSELKKQY